jgi:hypothetical protein
MGRRIDGQIKVIDRERMKPIAQPLDEMTRECTRTGRSPFGAGIDVKQLHG